VSDSFFRVSGLASGIDTANIIDQLMTIERRPIVKWQDRQNLLSWKKDYWTEINNSLAAMKTSTANLLETSTMEAKTATSGDETVLTGTATSAAAVAVYNITVSNLATTTSVRSGAGALSLGLGGAIDAAQPIDSSAAKFGTTPTAGTYTVNGVVFTLSDTDSDNVIDEIEVTENGSTLYTYSNAAGISLNNIITAFNDAAVNAATDVTASYAAGSDAFSLTADTPGGDLNLGTAGDTSNFLTAVHILAAARSGDAKTSVTHLGHVKTDTALSSSNFATAITGDGSGNGTFKINGVEIDYNIDDDDLGDVISRINNSDAGVVATYDSISDRLILTSKTTGNLSVTRENVTGNFLTATDLLAGATEALGENAAFTVAGFNGGNPIYSTSNTVSDVITGVSFTLKAESATAVELEITHNTTKAKDAIKDFVNKYNATMTLINSRLNEAKVNGADTDAEKRQGLLRGDRLLVTIRQELAEKAMNMVSRDYDGSADTNPIPASLDQLSEIGITITDTDFGKSGTLELNETVLDEKLRDNPATVARIFNYDSSTDTRDGVARRINDLTDSLTSTSTQIENGQSYKEGTIPRQKDVLDDEIEYFDERIDDLEVRLALREEQLIAEFTAMESALSKLQAMSNWLAAQINGLS